MSAAPVRPPLSDAQVAFWGHELDRLEPRRARGVLLALEMTYGAREAARIARTAEVEA